MKNVNETMTDAMKERAENGVTWKDEGGGYFSGTAIFTFAKVAYVALPEGHPLIGTSYAHLSPEVNGGLTFGKGDVFGWDYGHYQNDFDVNKHIRNALAYFRKWAKCCGELDEYGFCERLKGHKSLHWRTGVDWLPSEKGKKIVWGTR